MYEDDSIMHYHTEYEDRIMTQIFGECYCDEDHGMTGDFVNIFDRAVFTVNTDAIPL